MKKLIPTIALAALGAVAVTGSTYAWFSMNKSVEATGMKVKATTSGALVIGQSIETENAVTTSFSESAGDHILTHSTHDEGSDYSETNLKTLVEEECVVDPVTGVITTEVYKVAKNDASFNYFVDYTVYIASAGDAMADTTLTMTMNSAMQSEIAKLWAGNENGANDTLFGFTVDVYALAVSEAANQAAVPADLGDYKGAMHLDDVNASVEIVSNGAIPSSVNPETSKYSGIKVTMRVYLDGEYAKKTGSVEAATGTAVAGHTYFEEAAGTYTPKAIAVGESVTGLYEISLSSASATEKYVKNVKANSTDDLDLGFKFSI